MRCPMRLLASFALIAILLSAPATATCKDLFIPNVAGKALFLPDAVGPARSFDPVEEAIRDELGIPPDAEKVAIFSMSSHWDPDWLATFDMYHVFAVEPCITSALDILDIEPRYYYSISEIVFLRRYWDDHPGDHARILEHIENGHLRIVGGGMTSPDTLLPTGEALIRDWLYGNQWTMENLGVKPVTAWQPDSFGHSPDLPGALSGLGYDYVSFARVDRNTNQALRALHSADFVWQGLDNEEVLTHWMAHGYGQGDHIDNHVGLDVYWLEALGINMCSFINSSPDFVNPNIAGCLDRMTGLSPTGYIFIPMGGDFACPNPNLIDYMDNWNDALYAETGVWCVAATFEHYAMLVDAHREELPAMPMDINPYWTGFYATRPILKEANERCTASLTAAEAFSILAGREGYPYPDDDIEEAWDGIVFLNHHDGITGTSLDYVYYMEQIPMAEAALELAGATLADTIDFLADRIDTSGLPGTPVVVFNSLGFERTDVTRLEIGFDAPGVASIIVLDAGGVEVVSQVSILSTHIDGTIERAALSFIAAEVPSLGYSTYSLVPSADPSPTSEPGPLQISGELEVASDLFSITFSSSTGWCMTGLEDQMTGVEYIAGIGNDIVFYNDVGGLYRIGAEANPGTFCPLARTSESFGMIRVVDDGPVYTRVRILNLFPLVVRDVMLYNDLPRIELTADAATLVNTSATALFETAVQGSHHLMGIPFGEVERPSQSIYSPTFWPGKWVDTHSDDSTMGFAATNLGGRAWHFDDNGRVEVMLERHSFYEAGGFNEGALGTDREVPLHRYALIPHDPETFDQSQVVRQILASETPLIATLTSAHVGPLPPSLSLASSDNPAIRITALKKAEDSDAVILRLTRTGDIPAEALIRTNLPGTIGVYEVTHLETEPIPLPGTPSEFFIQMPTRTKTLLISY